MRTALPRALVLLSLALAACAAHDKAGDRAAALGDWKTAYVEYRQALADEPNDPKMKERYATARTQALAASTSAARGCAARRDWACAVTEADFALSIEPGNGELSELKRSAGLELALVQADEARALVAQGQLQRADATIREAKVSGQLVVAAVAEADRRRAARQYPEALAVLKLALPYEPGVRERIEVVQREQAAFLRAEHDRLMVEGDQLLTRNAWAEAGARFKAAGAAVPDERARAAEQYCRLAQSADAAVTRADWAAATRGYQEMVDLRVERNGYAAAQLGRVTIRPWAIRIRSALVTPLRPDGVPWVGPPSRTVVKVANEVVRAGGQPLTVPFLLLLNTLPRENQPNVIIEVVAPGSPPLLTPHRRGLYNTFTSSVVVGANGFERRTVRFRVFHSERDGVVEDIGVIEAPIGELISRGTLSLQSESIPALELSAEPAPGVALGSVTELTPPAPPPGQRPPPPAQAQTPPAKR
jgi:hypothetical protein